MVYNNVNVIPLTELKLKTGYNSTILKLVTCFFSWVEFLNYLRKHERHYDRKQEDSESLRKWTESDKLISTYSRQQFQNVPASLGNAVNDR